MHILTSKVVISAVLVREEDRKHIYVNIVSHVLTGSELNYRNIKKLVLSLITTSIKLRT